MNNSSASSRALFGRRIAMVTFSSYPADPRPRRAIEALLREGTSIDLMCLGADHLPKREQIDRLRIWRIPITQHRGGKLSYLYRYSAFLLASAIILALRSLKQRYDLAYVHNMPDILVFSAFLPKALGAKVILDLHDPMPELMTTIYGLDPDSLAVKMMRCLERWSLAWSHQVLTVNIACQRIFSMRSCPPEKIRVIMNSPDEQIFSFRPPRAIPPNENSSSRPFVIMYHGSIVERNGLDIAVQALEEIRLKVPTAQLRIYGRKTSFLEQVLDDVRQKGLGDRVFYLGSRTLENLVDEISACDIGVIPNHRNAFTDINTPTRIFEYLALGKPVIAPRTRGVTDYFDAKSLFFFESGNVSDLAASLAHCYQNPDEMRETACRGQQVYLAHTWTEERRKLIDTVERLLAVAEPKRSLAVALE
jgi:glycosyltransferase involved in cell wall biosynthesis